MICQQKAIIIVNYALVGEWIRGWYCIKSEMLKRVYHFGNEVLKVMLRFCLVNVRSLVAYLLPLPLSYPKKKSWQAQGRKQKPIQIR